VQAEFPAAIFHERARCLTIEHAPLVKRKFPVAVVAAGTSDLAVAEEVAVTLEIFGNKVERIYGAGAAGLHRLLVETDCLRECPVLIVVAGMEGALPSVIARLVDKPSSRCQQARVTGRVLAASPRSSECSTVAAAASR
jgi:hypothetical protein